MRRNSRPPKKNNLRLVPGIHSVQEALNVRPGSIKEIWLRSEWQRSNQLIHFGKFAQKKNIKLKELSLGKLDEVCRGHQGVVVHVDESPELDWDSLQGSERATVLMLDGIEDPQNLGAIMRTAWLMDVKAVFVPKDRAVGLSPTTCKIASGGAEHVPLVMENNFTSVIQKLKELGFWVYALAEKESETLYRLNLHHRAAWVVGAEDKGVRKATLKEADVGVFIPQAKSGSSYNASVAAALALSESARRP